MILPKYRTILKEIGARADALKIKAWIVGGSVRDFYLGLDTQDIDITVDGDAGKLAEFCVKKWGGKKEKFNDFGTYRVSLERGLKLDFVRARREVYPAPSALPKVSPSGIKEDLFRRDFTANAWARGILPQNFGESYDPFSAQKAIDGGYIKILHDKSFEDDATRMYRAVRFAGRFGWKVEKNTQRLLKIAVKEEYPLLLSRERIRTELIKILEEKKLKEIFKLMDSYGLSGFIYPGLKYTPKLLKAADLKEKIGVLALTLGDSGEMFLSSMSLPRGIKNEVKETLDCYLRKESPLKTLSVTQKNILRIMLPKSPEAAFEPCFVKGGELMGFGVTQKNISSVLKELRRLQWRGKIKNREEALKKIKALQF